MPVLGLRSRVVVSLLWFLCAFVSCGPDKKGMEDPAPVNPGRTGGSGGAGRGGSTGSGGSSGTSTGGAGVTGGSAGGAVLDAPAGDTPAGSEGGGPLLDGPIEDSSTVVIDARTMEAAGAIPDPIYTGPPRCFLQAIVRDFSASGATRHPDFESPVFLGQRRLPGPGAATLAANGPVRDPAGAATSTPGAGPACPAVRALEAAHSGSWATGTRTRRAPTTCSTCRSRCYDTGRGTVGFRSLNFFPVDGKGWNDQLKAKGGALHNFGFTTHVLRHFTYRKGQTFTFTGDDDVWVYVEGKQVIDLGGLHRSRSRTVNLDDIAAAAGGGQHLPPGSVPRRAQDRPVGVRDRDQHLRSLRRGAGRRRPAATTPAPTAAPPAAADGGDAGRRDAGAGGAHAACYMQAIIRDFRPPGRMRHPDFEDPDGATAPTPARACVRRHAVDGWPVRHPDAEGADRRAPARACATAGRRSPGSTTGTRTSPASTWCSTCRSRCTTPAGARCCFKSDAFFPIDGKGFDDKLPGDDGKLHNFGFTTHVLRHFTYKKGQTFTFAGDDDAWVVRRGQAGPGPRRPAPAPHRHRQAGRGPPALVEGNTYRLDFFHAERHSVSSSFEIETSICDRLNP